MEQAIGSTASGPGRAATRDGRSSDPLETARRSLLPYTGALIVGALITQIAIAAIGGTVGVLAQVLTAVLALGAAAYILVFGARLGRVRFGRFVAHAILYVVVTGSFALGAMLQVSFGGSLDGSWAGVTVFMPAFWSLGLLCHGLGALLSRGFEAERA